MTQHQDFLGRADRSWPACKVVAEYYHNLGKEYSVQIAAKRFAPTAAQASEYSDDGDVILRLIVEECLGKNIFWRFRVEVKWRWEMDFTCVEDFPFPTIMVAKVESVDKADDAVVYVSVSRDLKYGAFIPVTTRQHWTKVSNLVKNTGNVEQQYVCPKHLATFKRIAP